MIWFITLILYLIIKEKYNKKKTNTLYFKEKRKNNIIYFSGKIRFFEIKIISHKTLDLNAQKNLKIMRKKRLKYQTHTEKMII